MVREDLLLSNFQKPGSHPFLSITLFVIMPSQTPSWFVEINQIKPHTDCFHFTNREYMIPRQRSGSFNKSHLALIEIEFVGQLTHLDESEQSRSTRVLQSSHVHDIFRAQAYFLDKASKSSVAGGRGCARTGGAAAASPPLLRRYPVALVLRRRATKSDQVFCRSALPLPVLVRTAECHHQHHHRYSKVACIASLLLFC